MFKSLFRVALVTLVTTLALNACKEQPTTPPPPPPTFNLTGCVTHEQTPVTGAVVVATKEQTEYGRDTTDSKGDFEISNLPNTGKYTITTTAAGLQPNSLSLVADSSKPERAVCIMMHDSSDRHNDDSCCGSARITVIDDSSRQRVRFAYVEIHRENANVWHGKTDSNGVAEFSGLCKGYYAVTVSKDGYSSSYTKFAIDSCSQVNVEVHLNKVHHATCCGRLELTVCDNSNLGLPLANANVSGYGEGIRFSGVTDALGKFVKDGLCRGTYSISVEKVGYSTATTKFTLSGDSCPTASVKLCLDKKTTTDCCGKLVLTVGDYSRNCAALSGVKVSMSNQSNGGVTNDHGQYLADHLCKGEYKITLSKDGYKPQTLAFYVGDSCPTVTLKACLAKSDTGGHNNCCNTLNVTIIDDSTRHGVSGVTLSLIPNNSTVAITGTTDANGFFSFKNVCNGTYTLKASKDGYDYKTQTVGFSSDTCITRSVEMTLVKRHSECCKGMYYVTVIDADTMNYKPIAGVEVKLLLNGTVSQVTKTDSEGHASFSQLCSDHTYTLSFTKDGYYPADARITVNATCDPIKGYITLRKK